MIEGQDGAIPPSAILRGILSGNENYDFLFDVKKTSWFDSATDGARTAG
jgi:hypothetical protein